MSESQYNAIAEGSQSTPDVYECDCQDEKKFRVKYDGGVTGQFVMEFCQKCYDRDDKQFIISTEAIT